MKGLLCGEFIQGVFSRQGTFSIMRTDARLDERIVRVPLHFNEKYGGGDAAQRQRIAGRTRTAFQKGPILRRPLPDGLKRFNLYFIGF
jgi:hypothetical protein